MVSGSISLLYSRFFSPFPHGTGSLSVSWKYLALPDGTGRFKRDFSGPALLRIPLWPKSLRWRDYHPLWFTFPGNLASFFSTMSWSYNPQTAVTGWVWALSLSLATTQEIIIIFSSSGYLDVSVLQVRSPKGDYSSNSRVAPFRNLRITSYVPIPAAYRSLSRLSSPSRP